MPPGAQDGHKGFQNAKQGRSRPLLCGGPLPLGFRKFQLLQKFLLPHPQHLADWRDRVAQAAVAAASILPADHGFLRLDQPLVYQRSDVLLDSLPAHAHRRADGGIAGPALTAPHTLLVVQVNVHQQFTRLETELEYFIWHGEHRVKHLAGEPVALCGYPSVTGYRIAPMHLGLDGTQGVGEPLPTMLQLNEPSIIQCA